jgi:hypothetical protein
MKTTTLVRTLFAFMGLSPVFTAHAANLSIVLNPSLPSAVDPEYPGTGSTVTSVNDIQTGYTLSISGRDYGVDPTPGRPRWGLRTGPVPGDASRTGFIVTNGFTPAAVGATADRSGAPASFIRLALTGAEPGTVFQNVTISFDGLVFTRTTNAWAATSADGFAHATAARLTNGNGSGRQLNVSLPDFIWNGGPLLEFRVYGITGTDEGAAANVRLSANVRTIAVPEPATIWLALLALTLLVQRLR